MYILARKIKLFTKPPYPIKPENIFLPHPLIHASQKQWLHNKLRKTIQIIIASSDILFSLGPKPGNRARPQFRFR